MNRGSIIFYASIILILLLPNTFGKFIFNLAGGILILSISIPILITIITWLGFKIIQSKLNTCNSCGTSFSSSLSQCPICGSQIISNNLNQDTNINNSSKSASDVTIDIIPEDNID